MRIPNWVVVALAVFAGALAAGITAVAAGPDDATTGRTDTPGTSAEPFTDSAEPDAEVAPASSATPVPAASPTPAVAPTVAPTPTPTVAPTATPRPTPTPKPSPTPTPTPTATPQPVVQDLSSFAGQGIRDFVALEGGVLVVVMTTGEVMIIRPDQPPSKVEGLEDVTVVAPYGTGGLFAVGTSAGRVAIVEVASESIWVSQSGEPMDLEVDTQPVTALAAAPPNLFVAIERSHVETVVASTAGLAASRSLRFSGFTGSVADMEALEDGSVFAATSGGEVVRFDAEAETVVFPGLPGAARGVVAFGDTVAAITEDGVLAAWSIAATNKTADDVPLELRARDLVALPDGRVVAVGSTDNGGRICVLSSGGPACDDVALRTITAVDILDKRHVAFATDDGQLARYLLPLLAE